MVDLGLLLAFLLSIVSHGLALGMAYPTSLEAGITVSIRWSDGVIPYTMVVLNQANNNVLYSYYGNDNITYWDTNAAAGTVIIFKVTDADGTYLDSVPVTVNENPAFQSSSSIHSLSSISVASVSHDSRASISELSTASVASVSATMTTATSTIASSSVTRTSTTSGNGNSTTLLEASGVAGTSTLTSSTSPPATSSPAFDTSPTQRSSSHTKLAAIIGGVVGGILVLCVGLGVAFLWRRNRQSSTSANVPSSAYLSQEDRMRYFDGRTETSVFMTAASAMNISIVERESSFPGPSTAGDGERYPPPAQHFTGLPEV